MPAPPQTLSRVYASLKSGYCHVHYKDTPPVVKGAAPPASPLCLPSLRVHDLILPRNLLGLLSGASPLPLEINQTRKQLFDASVITLAISTGTEGF